MLGKLKELFALNAGSEKVPDPEEHEARLRIATCVILLEVARADEEFSDEEQDHILKTLGERFSLTKEEARELVEASTQSREESVDLWTFTHQINEACNREEKIGIIEEVWRVIAADGALHGHEDYLAHKLARLLNLNHRQLIDAKVKVLDELR